MPKIGKRRNKGDSGGGKNRALTKSARRKKLRAQRDQGNDSRGGSLGSMRRKKMDSVGTLDKKSAVAAIASKGIAMSVDTAVDVSAARKAAQKGAIEAARSLGVNIKKADGSLDMTKANEALSRMLPDLGKSMITAKQAKSPMQKAMAEAAASMGAEIFDANGNVDIMKMMEVSQVALNLRGKKLRPLSRREAADALSTLMGALIDDYELERREASDVIELLVYSSVLARGSDDSAAGQTGVQPRQLSRRDAVSDFEKRTTPAARTGSLSRSLSRRAVSDAVEK